MTRIRSVAASSSFLFLVGLVSACNCSVRTVQSRPSIGIQPTLLDFGVNSPGTTATKSLQLTNVGRSSLEISDVSVIDDPSSTFFVISESGRSADPGETLTVTVAFRAPGSPGRHAARLRIESNAENSPTAFVPLLAMSEPNPGPDAGASPGDGGSQRDAGELEDAGIDAGLDGGAVGDAGFSDAGLGDAGFVDSGVLDGGSLLDGGPTDGGFDGGGLATDGGALRCVAQLGSVGQDFGVDVEFDRSGSVIVTGYFENTVGIGSDTLTSRGGRDVFIAKYSSACQPTWARSVGGPGNDFGAAVAIDRFDHLFAAGEFLGTAVFGPGSGPTFASAGAADMYLLSLDGDGGIRWSARFGGPTDDLAVDVAVNDDGGVFLAAQAGFGINFGGGALPVDGGFDVVVAAFDSAGTHRWSASYGGSLIDQATSVACRPDGQPTVTGSFSSQSINFGSGPLAGSALGAVGFVAALEWGGTATWARPFSPTGPTAYASVEGAAVNGAGETFLAGTFEGVLVFGSTTLTTTTSGYDGFIAKLSQTGTPVWIRQYGGAGPDAVVGIATLSDGSVVATGMFRGTVDFGGGQLASAGGLDIFVLRLSGSGQHVWSHRYGSTGDDYGYGIAVNEAAFKVGIVGKFEGSVDFGAGPRVTSGPAGAGDAFVLMLDL